MRVLNWMIKSLRSVETSGFWLGKGKGLSMNKLKQLNCSLNEKLKEQLGEIFKKSMKSLKYQNPKLSNKESFVFFLKECFICYGYENNPLMHEILEIGYGFLVNSIEIRAKIDNENFNEFDKLEDLKKIISKNYVKNNYVKETLSAIEHSSRVSKDFLEEVLLNIFSLKSEDKKH